MPKNDNLSFLEQLSGAISGQTLTGGARALGEGIGYAYAGGDVGDIPQVMRDALDEYNQRTANQSKGEQDALAVASGLAAMSNPYSAIGHGIDFAAAVPEMLKYKLSDAEPPLGMIAETGLKRRLQKGGAQAEYAVANQLERAKANIRDKGYKINPYISTTLPLSSKGAKWGPGEGKFQIIQDYDTSAFDINKATNTGLYGMGPAGMSRIISGRPHPLGVEFANTMGLDPKYKGKGYGKEIYQNLADVYGGGISHSGSTSQEARNVYHALDAIDTGIPSGGGRRQALPTRQMKADPEALAAFEQRVKEYANQKNREIEIPEQPRRNDPREFYFDHVDGMNILFEIEDAVGEKKPITAKMLANIINSQKGTKYNANQLPKVLNFDNWLFVRRDNSDIYFPAGSAKD